MMDEEHWKIGHRAQAGFLFRDGHIKSSFSEYFYPAGVFLLIQIIDFDQHYFTHFSNIADNAIMALTTSSLQLF